MNMKKLLLVSIVAAIVAMFHQTSLQAQDLNHYKQIVKELSFAKLKVENQ